MEETEVNLLNAEGGKREPPETRESDMVQAPTSPRSVDEFAGTNEWRDELDEQVCEAMVTSLRP